MKRKFASIPWSLAILYFLSSVCQELPEQSLQLLMAKKLNLQTDQVIAYYTATFAPYSYKFFIGLLVDTVPIFRSASIHDSDFVCLLICKGIDEERGLLSEDLGAQV